MSLMAAVLLLAATSAGAIPIQYSDRATWEATVGAPIQTETLDSFVVDTEYRTVPVSLLNMSIQALDLSGLNASANFIDASGTSSFTNTADIIASIDGSGTKIRIDFDVGVSAWGADTFSLCCGQDKIDIFDIDNMLIGTVSAIGSADFWGFELSMGEVADYIVLRTELSTGSADAFRMDNLSFVTVSVPEPGTLALLGIGLVGMGLARRRKKV